MQARRNCTGVAVRQLPRHNGALLRKNCAHITVPVTVVGPLCPLEQRALTVVHTRPNPATELDAVLILPSCSLNCHPRQASHLTTNAQGKAVGEKKNLSSPASNATHTTTSQSQAKQKGAPPAEIRLKTGFACACRHGAN